MDRLISATPRNEERATSTHNSVDESNGVVYAAELLDTLR
jgi:hypothetical protein